MISDASMPALPRFDLRKALYTTLFLLPIATAISLFFSWKSLDRSLWQVMDGFFAGHIFLALVLTLVPWLTSVLRLINWTRFLGNPVNFRDAFKLVLANELGSAITPTSVGGGYIKVALLVEKKYPLGSALSLMTLGSLEDGLFFLFALPCAAYISFSKKAFSAFNLLHQMDYQIILLILSILLLVLAGVLFIATRQRFAGAICSRWRIVDLFRTRARRTLDDFKTVYQLIHRRGKKRFLYSLVLTSIQWSCRYSVLTVLLDGFGFAINPFQSFVMQWIVFTMMTFIPTPGAMIGAEASFYTIYHVIIPSHILGGALFLWRFFTYYLLLTIALIILFCLVVTDHEKFILFNARFWTRSKNEMSSSKF